MSDKNTNAMGIPSALMSRARKLDIGKITLEFSGGSDEGYLDVFFERSTKQWNERESNSREILRGDIDSWANQAYRYSGAGDGSRYGDTYVYDLVNKTVTHYDWWQDIVKGEERVDALGSL